MVLLRAKARTAAVRTSRDRDGAQTRERILEVAALAFTRAGYSGANLAEIADAVGIRKASLYYHFRTKSELYAEVMRGILLDLAEVSRSALVEGGSDVERVDRVVEAFIDFIAEHHHYVVLLSRELADARLDLESVLRSHAYPTLDLLVGFIRDGQAEGRFKPLDPVQLLVGFGGMIVYYFISAPRLLAGYFDDDPLAPERVDHVKEQIKLFLHRSLLEPAART